MKVWGKFQAWWGKLFRIIDNYDNYINSLIKENTSLYKEINRLNGVIKQMTSVGADVHAARKHGCTIVMIGQFRDQDYVEIFNMQVRDFEHIVRQLGEMSRHH